jgi:UDP-GlcNAc:undecaprenyl-phosphate GlcNAc-1-phosphate transferase
MLTLTPIVAFALAFLIALGVTPLVRRLAHRWGAVDHEDRRKLHMTDIPRLGGLAIALAFYVPVIGLAFRLNGFHTELYQAHPGRIAALLGGGLVILALGVYDDIWRATATKKLAIQIPVAIVAWWAGVRIGGTAAPGGHELVFSPALSLGITVLWIVGVVNALNLIDGLDGLASGIALQALAAVALCAWHRDELALALFTITLIGAVGGFLVYNFHPASVFMGDSGSMFLGYVLAIAAVWSSWKAATTVGLVLPAVALGLPLLDTSLAVWRRIVSRQPVMSADLDHIHHRVMAIGWSHRRTVLVLYGIGLFFSALSVAMIFGGDHQIGWGLLVLAVAVAIAIARWLGYLGPRVEGTTQLTQRKLLLRRELRALERRLRHSRSDEDFESALYEFEATADQILDNAHVPGADAVRVAAAATVAAARARRRVAQR